ncbi:MAG: nitroreductase family protein [Peptostreptococcaceae bacterium]
MEIKKSWIDACNVRVSRRSYIDKEINLDEISSLLKMIEEVNRNTQLSIQFVKDGKEVLNGFKASYGMISGVNSFIALVGNKDIENYKQQLGYYGEMLVLEATSIGLSTCWLGGTYNKKECENLINIKDNEEVVCIVAIGYTDKDLSIKEKVVKNLNKKKKSVEEMLVSKNNDIPSWVYSGVENALNSPSAVNKKPIVYEYTDKGVEAVIAKPNHGYEEVDLGISMLHFQLGAIKEGHSGEWSFENNHHILK